jgi:hypothetical protein
VGFWRRNPVNGGQDIFWQSRDNALLIKGGANYAYDQINDELSKFLARPAAEGGVSLIPNTDFVISVVGLRLRSEHEDDCWATVELKSEAGVGCGEAAVSAALLGAVRAKGSGVGKGCWPDFVRFGTIPVNFKGAIKVPELTAACTEEAKARGGGGGGGGVF